MDASDIGISVPVSSIPRLLRAQVAVSDDIVAQSPAWMQSAVEHDLAMSLGKEILAHYPPIEEAGDFGATIYSVEVLVKGAD